MKIASISNAFILICLVGCLNINKQICTAAGCIGGLGVSIKSLPNINDSIKVKMKTDLISEMEFYLTNDSIGRYHGLTINGIKVEYWYSEDSTELSISIREFRGNGDIYKNSKIFSFFYSDNYVEIDTNFAINFEPFYPNGYECDKDHPCLSDQFEINYERILSNQRHGIQNGQGHGIHFL